MFALFNVYNFLDLIKMYLTEMDFQKRLLFTQTPGNNQIQILAVFLSPNSNTSVLGLGLMGPLFH